MPWTGVLLFVKLGSLQSAGTSLSQGMCSKGESAKAFCQLHTTTFSTPATWLPCENTDVAKLVLDSVAAILFLLELEGRAHAVFDGCCEPIACLGFESGSVRSGSQRGYASRMISSIGDL